MQKKPPSSEQVETNEVSMSDAVAIAYALDEWYTLLGRQFGPLSRPQRRMLRLLDEQKGVRVGEIAEALGRAGIEVTQIETLRPSIEDLFGALLDQPGDERS